MTVPRHTNNGCPARVTYPRRRLIYLFVYLFPCLLFSPVSRNPLTVHRLGARARRLFRVDVFITRGDGIFRKYGHGDQEGIPARPSHVSRIVFGTLYSVRLTITNYAARRRVTK